MTEEGPAMIVEGLTMIEEGLTMIEEGPILSTEEGQIRIVVVGE